MKRAKGFKHYNNNNNKCVYSLRLQLVTFINENMSKNECMLRTNNVIVGSCQITMYRCTFISNFNGWMDFDLF